MMSLLHQLATMEEIMVMMMIVMNKLSLSKPIVIHELLFFVSLKLLCVIYPTTGEGTSSTSAMIGSKQACRHSNVWN
jgi:hypothetical protein